MVRRRFQVLFAGVLVAMLAVTGWASSQVALWDIPRGVALHPWFVATLFDTYFAFLTFWIWLAWRERSWPARITWLIAILLLGNIAMAAYVLIQLARLPKDAPLSRLFERRPSNPGSPG
jgi:drug/metabolite transporter (DMT)-like permease